MNQVLIAVGMIFATSASAESVLAERFNWLVGTWIHSNEGSSVIEEWSAISDDILRARGFIGKGGKRSSTETIILTEIADEVFYIAKARQNDLPISFRLVSASETEAVFENPNHDFPKRIAYSITTDGDLLANVSDGGDRGFSILFVREEAVNK